MQSLEFHSQHIIAYSEKITPITGGYILNGANVALEFPEQAQKYYRHGWQTWSLSAWLDVGFELPVQKPTLLHPLQTDPLYTHHPAPNGSWLGAVEFSNGNVLLLGSLGLEAHTALHDQQLHGWYEAGSGDWFTGYGKEAFVFARYAELLGERLGVRSPKPQPRVWCSWYSLYTTIDEPLLQRIFDKLDDLPFDVLQVDDGWQEEIGDWTPNEKFPSGMDALAAKIRASGRIPGLWLAPLIVAPSSTVFRQHPDWLLHDTDGKPVSAGFNWGEQLYALDTTHPETLDWLTKLMRQIRAWGFDYLKLDFLYAGALPGKRYIDIPREAAYRQGLKMMREAVGADAYFLTCGAPILPSLGLCDALRIGPDVSPDWENQRDAVLLYNPTIPSTKNAIRASINRLWLNPLVATDPDVAFFRSKYTTLTTEQKRMLIDLALVCGYKATSDLPEWLNESEREGLRTFLGTEPRVKRTGRYTFSINDREVNFSPAMSLPTPVHGFKALVGDIVGWGGSQRWIMKLLNQTGKIALQKLRNSL